MSMHLAETSTCAFVAAAFAFAGAAQAAIAPDRGGAEVVDQTCALCHATGVNGAPRIGDVKAWRLRANRGLSGLTKNAIEGVRMMPPHGGNLAVTDMEIKRAITYMINHSGGAWIEPIDRMAPVAERKGSDIVQAQCVKCHGTGVNGAPRIGDKNAWIQRARLGFDSVVRSAIHGHGAMPARGGMADLTDGEMRSAVTYMFQRSVSEKELPK